MKTMPTGLSRLAMILVNLCRHTTHGPKSRSVSIAAFAVYLSCLLSGCRNFAGEPELKVESHADYALPLGFDSQNLLPYDDHEIHLEVEPTGQLNQIFYHVSPKNLKTSPIVLKKIVHIKGDALGMTDELRLENTLSGSKASFADIIAIPTINNNDSLSPRLQTRKSNLTSAGYHLELLSDLAYMIILNPSGQSNRPPIHLNSGVLTNDKRLEFAIPKTQVLGKGRVTSLDPLVFAHPDGPLLQARILQGSRLISSVALVNNIGEFFIEVKKPLFEDLHDQPIHLVIEPQNEESTLPQIKKKLTHETIDNDFDLGQISLGDLNKTLSLSLELRGLSKTAVGEALIFLSGEIGVGTTLIKRQTDISGKTTIDGIYKGTYDIAILPSFASPYAMQVIKDIKIEEPNAKISIKLVKRKEFLGFITDHLGEPLGGAQIELLRIGENDNLASADIYDDMLFKMTAITNSYGQLCHPDSQLKPSDNDSCEKLRLDDGRFLAHIIPPAGKEIAHKWITFDFPKENRIAIRLGQPETLTGQIIDADRITPVKNAFITVYHAEVNPYHQAKVIGNAITDDHGWFKAFVSSP